MTASGSTVRGWSSLTTSLPTIAGVTMLGLSMAGSSSSLWWGIGDVLGWTTAAVTIALVLLGRLRGVPLARSEPGIWNGAAVTIPMGAFVGTLLFDGPPSVLAVTPILTIACSVAADRLGARRRPVPAVMCVVGATATCVLLHGDDLSAGFSTLVQGAIVSGLFVAVVVATDTATRTARH